MRNAMETPDLHNYDIPIVEDRYTLISFLHTKKIYEQRST